MNIVPIRVPPLRERAEDVPLLVGHFLSRLSLSSGWPEMAIDKPAMNALQTYSWPGNIRELRNVLERAVLLADSHELTVRHLQFHSSTLIAQPEANSQPGNLKQMERCKRKAAASSALRGVSVLAAVRFTLR